MDNQISVNQKLEKTKCVIVKINGASNEVTLKGIQFSPIDSTKLKIVVSGDEAVVRLGRLRRCIDGMIRVQAGGRVLIEDEVSFRGSFLLSCSAGATVKIGKDCMFSSNIQIRTTDSHAIYDKYGNHVNPDRDIIIGKHVWLGEGVRVLKGAVIGEGSVIGAGSIVSGEIPPFCVAAGVPAKVVKTEISWVR